MSRFFNPRKNYHEQHIVLCHYPLAKWNKSHHGSWNLHGHCHGDMNDFEKDQCALRLDVGTDCFNYTPISYEQVKAIMKQKELKSIRENKIDVSRQHAQRK